MRISVAIGFGFILGSVVVAMGNDFMQARSAASGGSGSGLGDFLAARIEDARDVVSQAMPDAPPSGGVSATWKPLLRAHPMLLPPGVKATSSDCSADSRQNYC